MKEWATIITEPRGVAAIQLANDDSLFNEGAFQAGAFQTLLENARRKRASAAAAPTAKPANDAPASLSGLRTWTDSTGRHSVEAEFVSLADGMVKLKKKNGKTVSLAADKLSEVDQAFLRSQAGSKNGAGATPPANQKPGEKPNANSGPAGNAEQLSAIAMVENWDIVALGEPFSARPGVMFPQEVFDARARESYKWWQAVHKVPQRERLAAKKALADLPQAEYDKQVHARNKVVIAWSSALTMKEHVELAAAEAGRPDAYFDARVREAYDWISQHVQLAANRRLERWHSAAATSADELKAELRARYDRDCRQRAQEPKASGSSKEKAGFAMPPEGWPKRTGDLSGSDEVRVKNPNDFQVRVGLRSAGKGKDFVVAAGGVQSVHVPNGKYDIYFQYSTDPAGLYQGDSFTLADNGVEIQIIKVVNGNYGIRKVK